MSHREHRDSGPRAIALSILTISDTRTLETDESGRLCAALCEGAGHVVVSRVLVTDDAHGVRTALEAMLHDTRVQAIVVNGGTGISPRDRTYETVTAMLETMLPGFGELFRMLSYQAIGPAAMLSRAVAGLARGRAVFCLPGSPDAVRLAMEQLILPELPHVVGEAGKRP